jgi:hypothetical protein
MTLLMMTLLIMTTYNTLLKMSLLIMTILLTLNMDDIYNDITYN